MEEGKGRGPSGGDGEERVGSSGDADFEIDLETLAGIVYEAPVVLFAGRLSPSRSFEPVWVCANAERILGYPLDELRDPAWWEDGIHPDDGDRVLAVRASLKAGDAVKLEYRFLDGSGSYRWIQAELRFVGHELDGVEVVGSWTDVTRRKRLEAELSEARKMRAVGRLAAGIAHDYNNLLTTILGSVDLIRQELDEAHAGQANLDDVVRAAREGGRLTRELLHFGGQEPVKLDDVSVNRLLDDVAGMLRSQLPAGVELSVSAPGGLPPVRADRGHLEQAVTQLVANARRAVADAGRIEVEARVVEGRPPETELPDGRYVQISVRDEGVGISDEDVGQIFEPFFRSGEPGEGTGLGLALVHQIARECGGSVRVRTEEGGGSAFSLFVPVADQETTPEAGRS